ncbi:hypothetical protein WN943_011934 [Citrus x changshan-huyou]
MTEKRIRYKPTCFRSLVRQAPKMVVLSGNVYQMLKDHDLQVQEAVRRGYVDKAKFAFDGFNTSKLLLYGNAKLDSDAISLTQDTTFFIGRAL